VIVGDGPAAHSTDDTGAADPRCVEETASREPERLNGRHRFTDDVVIFRVEPFPTTAADTIRRHRGSPTWTDDSVEFRGHSPQTVTRTVVEAGSIAYPAPRPVDQPVVEASPPGPSPRLWQRLRPPGMSTRRRRSDAAG
jgi:hypothetical protein